jgi:hypothetical protein
MTITGTLIHHGRIAGKPLHRQDARKGGAPAHTVVLPRFGVESLAALVSESGIAGPVFANEDHLLAVRQPVQDPMADRIARHPRVAHALMRMAHRN